MAQGVLGGLLAATGGMIVGHVLTKPNERTGPGWLRDLLSNLSPEHKAEGLTALRQVVAIVEQWAQPQQAAQQAPAEPPPTEAPSTPA